MYTCTVDGELFHFPAANNKEMALLSGTVTTELNRAGTFDFQLPPTNRCYLEDKFKKLTSEIEVFWNGERIFRGRILDSSRSFLGQINYKCEGWMSVLNDTLVIPDRLGLGGSDEKGITTTVAAMFNALISLHNSQLPQADPKRLTAYIDAKDAFKTKTLNFPWPSYEKTLDYLQSNIVSNENIGGKIFVESQDIHLVDINDVDYQVPSIQQIVQGRNLLDLTETIDATEVYTVIYPTMKDDAKLAGSGDIPDPAHPGQVLPFYKPGNGTIVSREGIANFGWITHYESYSDVEDQATLQAKALQALQASCVVPPSFDISAVDLNLVDSSQPRLRVGDNVTIMIPHYDIQLTYMCTQSSVDICNPANSKFTIGKTVDTMTTKQLAMARNIKSNTLKYGAELSTKSLTISPVKVGGNNKVELVDYTFYKANKTVYLSFTVIFNGSYSDAEADILVYETLYAPTVTTTGTAYDEADGSTWLMRATATNGKIWIYSNGAIDQGHVVTGNLTWMVK